MEKLFVNYKMGEIELDNRIVMAPMTRSRATYEGVPGELAPEYYSQRASMGLIISEGVQPSLEGQGYLFTPGIYTQEQVLGWKKVTNAVHESGGKIFLQLMHAGRRAHPDNVPGRLQKVAPSAIAPDELIVTSEGMKKVPVPRELSIDDIKNTINDFRKAAACAIEAGADGVEIHGANGYLIHQFLGENSNQRTDMYGGSIENRARFLLEVTKAIIDEIGAEKTGIRISPMNMFGDVNEGLLGKELYLYIIEELNKLNPVYVHVMHVGDEELLQNIRHSWKNTLIVNRAGRSLEDISKDVDSGVADLSSVGIWALANPDLVARLKQHAPLNEANKETIYIREGAVGYTDYPFLQN